MEIWTVENGKLVSYLREGECNQCGECCCSHRIVFRCTANSHGEEDDSEPDNLAEWEGWHSLFGQGVTWWFKIDDVMEEGERCTCLTADNLCGIWKDDDFPAICRYWPFHPSNLEKFPRCGFRFQRIDHDFTDRASSSGAGGG
jgi:Fe-S-cluster containining protein